MEVATPTTEANLSAVNESLVQIGVMLVSLKKTTAALAPTVTTTPARVPGQVLEQQMTTPSSPSLFSANQVVGTGALHEDAVFASATPTRCSTLGLVVNGGNNHLVVEFPPLGSTEEALITPLKPSLDKPLLSCVDLEFNMLTPTTCSMQYCHDDTGVQKSAFMSAVSSCSSPTHILLGGTDYSPTPSVVAVLVGVKTSPTVTSHMVDRMDDEMFTDVGGLSLFLELDLDFAVEVLNDSPLKDVVCDEELADYIVTHIGGSSLLLEHAMGTNEELEGKINKGTYSDLVVCVGGFVSLVDLHQPLSTERKQHGTNSPTLILPWDRGKQEVVEQDLFWQLTHSGKDTMATLPWDPGACCSLQFVSRNDEQQQIVDVFHYNDITFYVLNLLERIIHTELRVQWDPGILNLICQATLRHLIPGLCMLSQRINMVDGSYKSYGVSVEDDLSRYCPVHRHFSTAPLVVFCHGASEMLGLLVLSPSELVSVILVRNLEMERYTPVEENMPIILFDVHTMVSVAWLSQVQQEPYMIHVLWVLFLETSGM